MKISGFTMCRNADKFYYPIRESILSVLPMVDEFVVALGKGDEDDSTEEIIRSIGSDKLRIVHTEWDIKAFPYGTVHAQQTDVAKSHCSGDWLIYVQADEVIHERFHAEITSACHRYHMDKSVEGFLLDFVHFWGDYAHYQNSHSLYNKEIRVVRNLPQLHSWESAQSFRMIEDFDGRSYRKKEGSRKLRVKHIDAAVYHYGWVRPPEIMVQKMNELDRIHSHPAPRFNGLIDYGDLSRLPTFKGAHPEVMAERIAAFDWPVKHAEVERFTSTSVMRHQRLSSRLLTWIETRLLGGRQIMSHRNYTLIR